MYKKTFIALLDQALLSATNMIVAIMFIKFSSKIEYGEYSLACAITMFASGLHNTLIHLPLTITGNKIDAKDRAVFSASLCILLYAIMIPLMGIAAGYIAFVPEALLLQPKMCWVLIFSITGILTRELTRSLFFADLKVSNIFAVDILYAFLFVCLIGVSYFFHRLTASNIIAGMGVCSFAAAMFFVKSAVNNIQLHLRWSDFYKNILFSWKDSKWMVAGMSLSWLVNHGYLFLLAYLVSKESVAELNGTRVLLAPLMIIMVAWGKVFLPKGASMVHGKQHSHITGILVKSTLGLFAVAFCYIIALYVASDFLAESLYSGKYEHVGMYIILWGGFTLMTIISGNLKNLISIFSRFKELFFFSFINSTLFLIYSCFFISQFQTVGAVCSLIIAQIILSLQYGYYYYTKRNTMLTG